MVVLVVLVVGVSVSTFNTHGVVVPQCRQLMLGKGLFETLYAGIFEEAFSVHRFPKNRSEEEGREEETKEERREEET